MSSIPAAILDRYDALLSSIEPKCQPEPGTSFRHLRWMLGELRGEMEYGKANRWLGFIQGILVMHGMLTVPEERDFTRPHFQAMKS